MNIKKFVISSFVVVFLLNTLIFTLADDEDDLDEGLKENLNDKISSKTSDDTVDREAGKASKEGYNLKEQAMRDEKTFTFQAEVSRLMNIIINSLYTNKEIFLRELISNASDALDKIRFIAITDPEILGEGELTDLDIKIRIDKEAEIIEITDKGIGMTEEELINNLGTIAHSGTSDFLNKMEQEEEGIVDSNTLIGQFGVGFYSAFLVSDKVTVISKSNLDPVQHIWESAADQNFSVRPDPEGNTLGRGTRITLHLKDRYYLHEKTLTELIKKYSEFINFPIYIEKEETVETEVVDEEAMREEAEVEADRELEEVGEGEELPNRDVLIKQILSTLPPRYKYVTSKKPYWDLINDTRPIWTRAPHEITEEEYNSFYRAFTRDEEDPLTFAHFEAEGDSVFKALLYVPTKAPENLWDTRREAHRQNIRLYVRRVFITGDFFDILPTYLRFVRGVIDSDDLPLNVSRETIHESRAMERIRRKIVRKTLQMILDMAESDRDKFISFTREYSYAVKVGLIEDVANRSRLSKLLLFNSSKSGDRLTTLDEYIERMKEDQENIYYIAGESLEQVTSSPLIERLLDEDIEVLYLTEAIDENAVTNLGTYESKYKLVNIGRDGVKFSNKDINKEAELKEEFAPIIDHLGKALKEKVEKVKISTRLKITPVALVSSLSGYSANMERILKIQSVSYPKLKNTPLSPKKVLEINPTHPIIIDLNRRLSEGETGEEIDETIKILYSTGLLNSGYSVDDTSEFAGWIHSMMIRNLHAENVKPKQEEEGHLEL